MIFEPTGIDNLWLIRVERHADARGSFGRTFCKAEFAAQGLTSDFVQSSSSRTAKAGTIRGMHLQIAPHAEAKLVRCVRGAIHDVVCDLRAASPTRLQSRAFDLRGSDDLELYVPPGCAHGFQTLTDDVEVIYAMSCMFAPGASAGIRYDDPAAAIAWPLAVTSIADKDLRWPAYDRDNFDIT